MAETFDILVIGDTQLQAFIGELPARVNAELQAAMRDVAALLEGAVVAAEPSRTGKLRSATRPFVRENPAGVTGGVQVRGDAGKAGALEYGAHRAFSLKEHWARRSVVFGREAPSQSVLVDEYVRRANITADRFLRDPFAALQGQILARIEKALGRAASAPGD